MFTLSGFIRPAARDSILEEVQPVLCRDSFTHSRSHNVYFEDEIPGLAADHPALREGWTTNHTVCGDQIAGSSICRIYEWQPLVEFLTRVMGRKRLYLMDDPMAALNVLEYRSGEPALNWHFDRSEFTTTLLLCAADRGGEFQYRSALRTANDPNFEGVAALLADDDPEIRTLPMTAGTLCVFRGVETASPGDASDRYAQPHCCCFVILRATRSPVQQGRTAWFLRQGRVTGELSTEPKPLRTADTRQLRRFLRPARAS